MPPASFRGAKDVQTRVISSSTAVPRFTHPLLDTLNEAYTLIEMPVLPAPPLHDKAPFVVLSDWVSHADPLSMCGIDMLMACIGWNDYHNGLE